MKQTASLQLSSYTNNLHLTLGFVVMGIFSFQCIHNIMLSCLSRTIIPVKSSLEQYTALVYRKSFDICVVTWENTCLFSAQMWEDGKARICCMQPSCFVVWNTQSMKPNQKKHCSCKVEQ